jgi:hypothetical protein
MTPVPPQTECERNRELLRQLAGALARLHGLLGAEKEAVERRDRARMEELEAEIERALAEKSETLHSVRRHLEEHQC